MKELKLRNVYIYIGITIKEGSTTYKVTQKNNNYNILALLCSEPFLHDLVVSLYIGYNMKHNLYIICEWNSNV